jgi:hypothetical protein
LIKGNKKGINNLLHFVVAVLIAVLDGILIVDYYGQEQEVHKEVA